MRVPLANPGAVTKTREKALLSKQPIIQPNGCHIGLRHQVQRDAPARQHRKAVLCTDALDRHTVPNRRKSCCGAQLGIIGHAVSANELSALRGKNSNARPADDE
jgi:hypothetical protein